MIRITGDTHGDPFRFTDRKMPGQSKWGSEDKIIVCGDFGYLWYDSRAGKKKLDMQERVLDTLATKPYEILFIDGNHENFDLLYKNEEERYGAPVHKIRDNIYHLQRGRIYTIEGKTFYTFGGAASVDKARRDLETEWWAEELPSEEEYVRGEKALEQVGNVVDYVITHTAPDRVIQYLRYYLPPEDRNISLENDDELLRYKLGVLWDTISFKKWYFGHWHIDKELPHNARALLMDVEIIE